MTNPVTTKTKVWDGAVRSYHGLQLLCVVLLWWSAERELFGLHQATAYLLGALLTARFVWGLVGSETARFADFVYKPWRILPTLKHTPQPAGHNALSGYMILALWLLLLLQIGSGLMSSDDLSFEGPLFSLAPDWLQSLAGRWHDLGFNLLLGLTALHVLAALLHEAKGQGVIASMVTGRKKLATPRSLYFVASWRYWALVAACLGLVYGWQGDAVWPALVSDLQSL